jgi:hypothetical protein
MNVLTPTPAHYIWAIRENKKLARLWFTRWLSVPRSRRWLAQELRIAIAMWDQAFRLERELLELCEP